MHHRPNYVNKDRIFIAFYFLFLINPLLLIVVLTSSYPTNCHIPPRFFHKSLVYLYKLISNNSTTWKILVHNSTLSHITIFDNYPIILFPNTIKREPFLPNQEINLIYSSHGIVAPHGREIAFGPRKFCLITGS